MDERIKGWFGVPVPVLSAARVGFCDEICRQQGGCVE